MLTKLAVASLLASGTLSSSALAQFWFWPPPEFSVDQVRCVGTGLEVTISVSGQWPDSCLPRGGSTFSVTPGRLDLVIDHGFPPDVGCLAVIMRWQRTIVADNLPPGSYEVFASMTSNHFGNLPPERIGSFSGSCRCVCDFDDGSATGTPDDAVTIDDLLFYLALFEQGHPDADLDDGSGVGAPDAAVDIDDLLYFFTRFEAGC